MVTTSKKYVIARIELHKFSTSDSARKQPALREWDKFIPVSVQHQRGRANLSQQRFDVAACQCWCPDEDGQYLLRRLQRQKRAGVK